MLSLLLALVSPSWPSCFLPVPKPQPRDSFFPGVFFNELPPLQKWKCHCSGLPEFAVQDSPVAC